MAFTPPETVDARRFCGYAPATPAPPDAIGLLLAAMPVEVEAVARGFVGQLRVMETGLVASAEGLDTSKAAVWERQQDEVMQRQYLYGSWRREFCLFLGVPPGPFMPALVPFTAVTSTGKVVPLTPAETAATVYDPAVFLV